MCDDDIIEMLANLSGTSLVIIATAVSIYLGKKYTTEELVSLGTFLTATADLLLLEAQQKAILKDRNDESSE